VNRRAFLGSLASGLLAAPLAAEAQRSALLTDSVGPIADLTIEFHIVGEVV